jgi:MFS family permease
MNRQTPHGADRNKLLILAAVCLSALVLPLAFSGGAVATPAIGRDLGGSPAMLTWVTNAFMLSFGSLLMAAGALADQFGRKRLFVLGLGGFVVTSLAMSFAPSTLWLDILRATQGITAAASLSSGAASLAQEFEGHARTRAFSMLGTSFGIGLAFGPLMAGTLIEHFGWRSIFMVIAVIGVIAFIFGVPRMRERDRPRLSGHHHLYRDARALHVRRHSGAGKWLGQSLGCDLAGIVGGHAGRIRYGRDASEASHA